MSRDEPAADYVVDTAAGAGPAESNTARRRVAKAANGDDDEMARLELAVFGGLKPSGDTGVRLKRDSASSSGADSDDDAPDEVTSKRVVEQRAAPAPPPSATDERRPRPRRRVWVDDDDSDGEEVPPDAVERKPVVVALPAGRRHSALRQTTESAGDPVAAGDYRSRLVRAHAAATGHQEGTPSWARLPGADGKKKKRLSLRAADRPDDQDSDRDDDDIDESACAAGTYIGDSAHLPQTVLSYTALTDANFGYVNKMAIRSVQFNRLAPVVLCAGDSHKLQLFKVGAKPEDDRLVQSTVFERYRIECARFSADAKSVILASTRRPFLYILDLMTNKTAKLSLKLQALGQESGSRFEVSPSGDYIALYGSYGKIHIFHAKTFEWLSSLKMNGSVDAMCFAHHDDSTLFSFGDAGEVYVWDVRRMAPVHRYADEGCVRGTALALGHDEHRVACGANTGVLNVYETAEAMASAAPRPIKAIGNLTTAVDALCFNPSSELLSSVSSEDANGWRLLHTGSMTTMRNFPGRTKLDRVTCADFSPNGGYMAAGNCSGRLLLYRLNYYSGY